MTLGFLYFYSLMLIVGGVIGYRKAGSKVSLIMGLLSGVIVLIACLLANSNLTQTYFITSIVAGILTVVFAIRLLKTKKFMPAGLLIILSVIALSISVSQLLG